MSSGRSKRKMASPTKKASNISNISVDREDVVQSGDSSKASNKLDVMTSKQYNRLTFLNIAVVLYTFIHVIFVSVACRTVWVESVPTKGIHGEQLSLLRCNAPLHYMLPLYVVDIAGRSCLIIFSLVFAIRIFRTKMRRSKEQIWTVIMVIMTALSYNPVLPINLLHDRIIHPKQIEKWLIVAYPWFYPFLRVNRSVCLFISSAGQLFYIWAVAHEFGILEEMGRPSNLRFYGPKVLCLASYNVYRLTLTNMSPVVSPSKLPWTTGVAMLVQFKYLEVWETDVFLKVMGLTVVELIIMIGIIRRICITARVLREAQYVKYRGKQIGFRYFVMQNIITYSLFLFADVSIMALVPRYVEIRTRLLAVTNYDNIFWNILFGPVPRLLNYATTAITAYVNLPADSVGFLGWFKGSELNQEVKQPITLTARSNRSGFNLNHMSSTIVFDLLVELFNISDVVYMKRSNAVRSQIAHEYTLEKGYNLELEIFNKVNETYATVFAVEDKIIVAFKGTTTMENMKTDLLVKMVSISDSLPSKKDSRHKLLSSMDWKNAKIHKGFATAYLSVCDELIEKISTLHIKQERPIYFTGHSLGASLATIASLDVVLSLGIKDVYVVTIGSPRCGNMFWSRAYDQVVLAHWRVAMRSDIVTTFPRAGYSHIGKRVALTKSGEMFLDPNAIETVLWSSAGVNVSDHAKPAYQEALLQFSKKYLAGFVPEFVQKEAGVPE